MDPVTQGALGATASVMFFGKSLGRWALPIGVAGGMAADLDVLIPYVVDLELPWRYHRHFTHSLLFVPVGGALVALLFMLSKHLRGRKLASFGAATLAYATHGALDTCTSYGTHLRWPFDHARDSWDVLPIAEPLLTLLMLSMVLLGTKLRRCWPGWVAAGVLAAWTVFGFAQRDRALAMQGALAESRGHEIEHGRVFPMPLSMCMWRSLYRTERELHADAFRLVPFVAPQWLRGGKLLLERPVLPASPEAKASLRGALLAEYDDFADGFTGRVPSRPELLGDFRFVNGYGFESLWAIDPGRGADAEGFRFLSPLHGVRFDDLIRLARRTISGEGFEDFPVELLGR